MDSGLDAAHRSGMTTIVIQDSRFAASGMTD
jgi:hypothetical protein